MFKRVRDGFVSDGYDSAVQDILVFRVFAVCGAFTLGYCWSVHFKVDFILFSIVSYYCSVVRLCAVFMVKRLSFDGSVGHFGFSTFFVVVMN